MNTKEEYLEMVLKCRDLLKDPKITKCICPDYLCEWHGKCKECISLHRYYNDHVPNCLKDLIKSKTFVELANIVEMTSVENNKIPIEFRKYAKEMSEKQ